MSKDAAGLVGEMTLKPKSEKTEEGEKKSSGKNSGFETFPWLQNFRRLCREAVGSRNIKVLESLLSAFVKQVAVSIQGCYSRPNRASKLRRVVNETLVYFNMFYQDLKFGDGSFDAEFNFDNLVYLDLMTDLMAMYLDLEIKASKKEGADSLKKIGQIMTSSLYVFLDHSEDHITEAILKAKLITKDNGELCAPVLSKFLKEGKCFIAHEDAYIRYLLAFKLWKKLTAKPQIRTTIDRMAGEKLDPPPQLIANIKKMNHILPKMPKINRNMTEFLMKTKFNFIKAKREFLKTSNSISNSHFSRGMTDKPFVFGDCLTGPMTALNEKDSKGRRSKHSFFRDDWSNISAPGTGFQQDKKPRVPQLPTSKTPNDFTNEEDPDGVEFIGVASKKNSSTVVITIDSEEETEETYVSETSRLQNKENGVGFRESILDKIKSDVSEKVSEKPCLRNKNKKKRDKTKRNKNVPKVNLKASLKTRDDECSSTKQSEVTQRLHSPEHGIADSTSSNIDDNFRSPRHQVYEIHSNTSWDDVKTEVASSSESTDICGSSERRLSTDSAKTKTGEISSTRQNSVPSSYSVGSINSSNSPSESYNSELPASYRKIRVLSPKELHYKSSRTTSEFDNTISNGSVADSSSKTLSPVSKSLVFEEKSEADSETLSFHLRSLDLNEKENLAFQKNLRSSPRVLHSGQNSKSEVFASEKEKKLKKCDSNSEVGKSCELSQHSRSNESRESETSKAKQTLSNYKWVKSKDLSEMSSMESKSQPKESLNHVKEKPSEPSKKLTNNAEGKQTNNFVTAHKLDQLVINAPKKVEFENVAKSYKIVKSNVLKKDGAASGSLPKATTEKSNEKVDKQLTFLPKLVQIKSTDLKMNPKAVDEVLKTSKVPPTSSVKTSAQFSLNSVVDDVPEFAQEELVCATTETDGFQVSTSKLQEITINEVKSNSQPVHQNSKSVNQWAPIIFKKISEEPNQKKTVNSKHSDIASSSSSDSQRFRVVKSDNLLSSIDHSKEEIVIQTEKVHKSKPVTQTSAHLERDKLTSNSVVVGDSKIVQLPLYEHTSYDAPSRQHVGADFSTDSTNQPLSEAVDNGSMYFEVYGHPNTSNPMYFGNPPEVPCISLPQREQIVSSSNLESSLESFQLGYETSRHAPNIPVNSSPQFYHLPETNPAKPEISKVILPPAERAGSLMCPFDGLNRRQVKEDSSFNVTTPGVSLHSEDNTELSERLGLDLCSRSEAMKNIAGVPRDYVIGERTDAEPSDADIEDLRNFSSTWELGEDHVPGDDGYFLNFFPGGDDAIAQMLGMSVDGILSDNPESESFGRPNDLSFPKDLSNYPKSCQEYSLYKGKDAGNFPPDFIEDYNLFDPVFDSEGSLSESCNPTPEEDSGAELGRRHSTRIVPVAPTSEDEEQKSLSDKESNGAQAQKMDEKEPEKKSAAKQEAGQMARKAKCKREGSPVEKGQLKKQKSDTIPYHTRSLTQRGIPVEFPTIT